MNYIGTLSIFCGKMGVGKTTYSKQLAIKEKSIYISEDYWLSTLYPKEIRTFDDYITYSSRIKPLVIEFVTSLLKSGVSVIMDFPGNTMKQRQWLKKIISEANCPHKLYFLNGSDELCLSQIEKRRQSSPERNHFDTKEVFIQITKYFQLPKEEEDFNIIVIDLN